MNMKIAGQTTSRIALIVLLGLIASLLVPALANAQMMPEEPIDVLTFQDPDSGELVKLVATKSGADAIRKFSPENFRKERDVSLAALAEQCASSKTDKLKKLGRFVTHDLPIEATAFNMAIALSVHEQFGTDPAAVRHLATKSLADPSAHATFVMFVLANHGMMKFMSMVGAIYDPCDLVKPSSGRAVVRYNPYEAALNSSNHGMVKLQPSRAQKLFSPLIGPIGLAAGTLASSLLQEVLADPDIKTCAKGMGKDIPEDVWNQACDRAYDNWAVSEKIMQYAPDLISMTGTFFIQAYLINAPAIKLIKSTQLLASRDLTEWTARAAAQEALKYKWAGSLASGGAREAGAELAARGVSKLAFRALSVGWRIGAASMGGPYLGFALTVFNIYMFIDVNNVLLNMVKTPVTQAWQGRDVTNHINTALAEIDRLEKANWIWTPPPLPAGCDDSARSAIDAAEGGVGALIARNQVCFPQQDKPGHMIRRLGELHQKWRQFQLAEAYQAHSNWKDYVVNYVTMYTNAFKFYEDIVNTINWQKNEPERVSYKPQPLYMNTPFNGLSFKVPTNVCDIDAAGKYKVNEAIAFLQKEISDRTAKRTRVQTRTEIAQLTSILTGIEALDCTRELIGIGSIRWQINLPLTMSRAEQTTEVNRDNTRPKWQSNLNLPSGMSREQQTVMVNRNYAGRTGQFETAMNLLNQVLRTPGVYSDGGIAPFTPRYQQIVQNNPFARLRQMLGDPKPLGEGIGYLLDVEDGVQSRTGALDNDGKPDQLEILQPGSKGLNPRYLKFAATPKMTDYLLASMVCGGSEWNVLNVVWKSRAEFKPPRIVGDLPFNNDICLTHAFMGPTTNAQFDIYQTQWTATNGQTYTGLLDVVKSFIRPDFLTRDAKFAVWWGNNVDPIVLGHVKEFRSEYEKLLQEKFFPKINDPAYEAYNGRNFALGTTNSLLDEAKLNMQLIAKSYKAGRAGKTVRLNALMGKIRLNLQALDLMTRLTSDLRTIQRAVYEIENPGFKLELPTPELLQVAKPLPRFPVGQSTAELLKSLPALPTRQAPSADFSDLKELTSPRAQAAYKKVRALQSIVLQDLKNFASDDYDGRPMLDNGQFGMQMQAIATLKEIRTAAFVNLDRIATEIDSYYGVINTIAVDGLE